MRVRLCSLVAASMLSACGGGGGGGVGPTPPANNADLNGVDMVLPPGASLDAPASFKLSGTLPAGLQATWEFGDGTQATGQTVDHDYHQSGALSVTLRLSLPGGATRVVTRPLQVQTWSFLRDVSCTGGARGGWCAVPTPQADALPSSVAFVDADTGWVAAGEWVLRTRDGGRQWQPTHLPFAPTELLAIDAQTVAAFNSERPGRLMISSDGGRSFADVPLPNLGVAGYVLNYQKGGVWVVQSPANAFASNDQGKTWRSSEVDPRVTYAGLAPLRGVMSLDSAPMGRWRWAGSELQRSQDGGVSYQRAATVPASCAMSALVVSGPRLLVYPSGEAPGRACTSPDGGQHWQELPSLPQGKVLEVGFRGDGGFFSRTAGVPLAGTSADGTAWLPLGDVPPPSGVQIFTACSLTSVQDLTTLFGQCWSSRGPVWDIVSTDGGGTWRSRAADGVALTAPDPTRLTLSSGLTLRLSSNRRSYESPESDGIRWYNWALPIPQVSLGDAVLLDARTLAAYGNSESRRFSLSRDGGKTWSPFDERALHVDYLSVDATGGLWRRRGQNSPLEVSRDQGQSFQTVLGPEVSDGYTAFDTRRADWWLMGGANITSSTDGGKTWTWTALSTPVSHVLTMDGMRGLAMVQPGYGPRGQACVLLTQDRGQHWGPCVDIGTDRRVNAVTYQGDTVWAVGYDGVMRVSRDGGQTWRPVNLDVTESINHVRFATPQRGWAVGDRGLMLSTTDGGQTWVRVPRLTQSDLLRISVVDEKTVWIAGTNILLATATGGE